ncbi:MAG TPA: glycosyl hydrolase family 18 protein [Allosphingosinicella sp.]|nr:glycosyl hydrolase family 18 protein [Allosphingosinicella sp.]
MTRQSIAAYWLPTIGIGPQGSMDYVHVPLTDVLNYRRADGTLQVDIVNLWGCTFNPDFGPGQYLDFDPLLQSALSDGEVGQLQAAGIKVVLTIVGSGDNGGFGWGSIPADQQAAFVAYLNEAILSSAGLGLDGIDIDDEYPSGGSAIVPVVQAMRAAFPEDKILSKALFSDSWYISQIAASLSYGAIMTYGDSAEGLEGEFNSYVTEGFAPEKVMIGVNAGPVAQGGTSFTSVATAETLAVWQPEGGQKMGMMVWSFSQDIQQFTAFPQNQPGLMFPNPEDHEWQRAISAAMDGCAGG